MDKIVNGVIYTKARFLRTTCKNCGKQLSNDSIERGYKWCNKACNLAFKPRKGKRMVREGEIFYYEGNSV